MSSDPPRSMPPAPNGAPESKGWDAISEWTDGFAPEDIPALAAVRDLESVYPLLHALVGPSSRDFFVRAAALESLVAAGRGAFSTEDLEETLSWLSPEKRDGVLRALRRSGWLAWDPATGTTITAAGHWAYDVLSFLHRRLRDGELKPTISGIEYALDIGLDPMRHLRSMRSRLVELREQMSAARASHSEVVLRRSVARLRETLDLSAQVRAVLDRVPARDPEARAVIRDVHELLSRLHHMGSDLQAAITEVGRQFLRLTAGLTVEQIVTALMSRSIEDLAEPGRDALLPAVAPPPLLTSEVVAAAAEQQFLRVREEPPPVRWEEPPRAPRGRKSISIPEEVEALLADLAGIEKDGRERRLEEVLPRDDSAVSFLRTSLLSLVGDPAGGEGIAGKLGAFGLDPETEGDGWPTPLADGPLAALTPGRIRPRRDDEETAP